MARDEALAITVDEVSYRSDDGRFVVVRARSDEDGPELVAIGDLGGVAPGETLSVRGRFEQHAQYGRRFKVESFAPITPRTRAGIERYLGSGLIPGVGPSIAARLVARFGERTLEVITTQSARLREVSGIGAQRANAIAEAVRNRADEAAALSYLQGLGLGPALSKRVRKHYGQDAVRVLRDDPYLVAEQVAGVGFATADRLGRALGYAHDDPRRAAGAALHVIGRAADEGHVFLYREQVLERGRALDVPEPTLLAAIETLQARGLLVVDGDAVYAPPLYAAEVETGRRLRALTGARQRPAGADAALASAFSAELSDEQRRAVEMSLQTGLLVLTGGPGTGKTTAVRALLRAHTQLGRRVSLCAPTGRAAKRLAEATSGEAQTIHRLLEFNPASARFMRDADQPLDADVVLVDEASMLDLLLGQQLLRALPAGCTLVLVGDVDQLPPVGPGPLLRELIRSGACPVVRLTQIFRQAQRSAIVRGAHAILNGHRLESTPANERGDGDLFVVRAHDPELAAQRVLATLERVRAAYGLDPKRDVQVLSPMRKGPLGVTRLNELLQHALNPGPEGAVPGRLRRGDKVMQLRNDYDREVFNGDLGEVLEAGSEHVVVEIGGRKIAYDRDARESLALAYASTIHKVQGSEFPAVIVVLHTTHFALLGRALIYTAITRAKRLAIIVGDERAIGRAIHNIAEQRTNSRLEHRLLG
jgi:exodeoxyribonuclease V alpha subunit